MGLENVLTIIIYSIPIYSSVTCALLMVFTYHDCISLSESRIKLLLIFYYIASTFIWFGTITFNFSPSLFIYLNPIFYFCLLLASVVLYHFLYYLTATEKSNHFSMWHYQPPVVIFLFIFIWSLFIPYDTQYAIVSGNAIVPEYEYYSIFYISKHILRIIFLGIYSFLCIRKLYFYSKRVIDRYGAEYKKYIYWLWYVVGLIIVIIIVSIITLLSPYTHIHKLLNNFSIVLLIATAHAVLAYNIIRRNYHLIFSEKKTSFKQESEKSNQMQNGDTGLPTAKNLVLTCRRYTQYQKKIKGQGNGVGHNLTKKQFELYFKEYKPYLNPDLRITDLMQPFEVNRTYISRFINKEYGMNFSRYVNRCRLQKLEMLMSLASCKGKSLQDLLKLAGFGSYRSYMRAKLIEEEEINKKKRNK